MSQRLKHALPKLLLILVVVFFLVRTPWSDAISMAIGFGAAIYIVAAVASVLLSHRNRVWSAWSIFAFVTASIFLIDRWSPNGSALDIAANIGIVFAIAGLFMAFVFVNRKTSRPTVMLQGNGSPERRWSSTCQKSH